MTSIVHFSPAEWNRRLAKRGRRRKLGRKTPEGSAEIVIFPGVRVEYWDGVSDDDTRLANPQGGTRHSGRLQIGPLIHLPTKR